MDHLISGVTPSPRLIFQSGYQGTQIPQLSYRSIALSTRCTCKNAYNYENLFPSSDLISPIKTLA